MDTACLFDASKALRAVSYADYVDSRVRQCLATAKLFQTSAMSDIRGAGAMKQISCIDVVRDEIGHLYEIGTLAALNGCQDQAERIRAALHAAIDKLIDVTFDLRMLSCGLPAKHGATL